MQKVGSQGPCCSEVHAAHMPVPSHQVVIPGTTATPDACAFHFRLTPSIPHADTGGIA